MFGVISVLAHSQCGACGCSNRQNKKSYEPVSKHKIILLFVSLTLLSFQIKAEVTPGYLLFHGPLINKPFLEEIIPPEKNILDSNAGFNKKSRGDMNSYDVIRNLPPPPWQTDFYIYPVTHGQEQTVDQDSTQDDDATATVVQETEVGENAPEEGATAVLEEEISSGQSLALSLIDFTPQTAGTYIGILISMISSGAEFADLTTRVIVVNGVVYNLDPRIFAFLLYWTRFALILNRYGREEALRYLQDFRDRRLGVESPSSAAEERVWVESSYFTDLTNGVLPAGQPILEMAFLPRHFTQDYREYSPCWDWFAKYLNSHTVEESFEELRKTYQVIAGADDSRLRREYGMYFTPSLEWLRPVVRQLNSWATSRNITLSGLEIFSGNAALSFFLQSLGIPMLATTMQKDTHFQVTSNRVNDNLNFPVTMESAQSAVVNHPEANFLVISWPDERFDPRVFDVVETEVVDFNGTCWRQPSFKPGHPFCDDRMLPELDKFYPVLAAIVRWQQRGPILFIGLLSDSGDTHMPLLFDYLDHYYEATSFEEHYQSSVWGNDYPTLYLPRLPPDGEGSGQCSEDEVGLVLIFQYFYRQLQRLFFFAQP
ncbi:hypothetical protein [Endozoicomonas lisbonensis]|uniref:Uncharacterized protein n=1 Tax=Endozoicomonas lisbonensis TaxID=3120522 RepID=A0ABV2SK10_9GAMM